MSQKSDDRGKEMQHSSQFPGPNPDDYANVRALNGAFIEATCELKGPQRGRLAAAPFLLFSLREDDTEWWATVLAEPRQRELMAAADIESSDLRQIQTAALSFLWQLGRRNPYAVRIITGAAISWCQKITDLPLVILLERVSGRGDLMVSRLGHAAANGEWLLGRGTSARRRVRQSSHLTVLQALLTRNGDDNYARLPAAACGLSAPLRVLDEKV